MDNYLHLLKEQVSKKIVTENVNKELVKFFLDNPNPDDKEVHKLADKLNMEPDDLEEHIYALLSSLLKVGKHRKDPVTKYNSKQIKMGIEVEKEHTDDPDIAVEIAKDHLAEIPDYYTRLKKMEDDAKK